MFPLFVLTAAYLRTQAAAKMVSGCVSRFAMPSQPRWNGEGTPNQAGHGSTAANLRLQRLHSRSINPPPPTIGLKIPTSRILVITLSCLAGFRDGCEGQGDGDGCRWPRPPWTCSRGLRQRRPRCQRPTTRHKICNALPSFLHHFEPLQLT